MHTPKNYILRTLKDELGRLFIISVSVFLFILFFQPFPLDFLAYDDRLLYVTGFGGITFLTACVILILLPLLIPKWFEVGELESGPPFILGLLFIIFTAIAFAFYIRFVGKTPISLYILFKVLLICVLPLIILMIIHKNKLLQHVIGLLQDQNKYYISKISEYENLAEDEEIEILSSNKSDKLSLPAKNIISVKSADNYIEISYLENDLVEKKLIRTTLKSIESQLAGKRNFIRCHRTGIVNINYIEKLVRSYNGYSLKMSLFDEKIPVSRQYLLLVKESISGNE